jgi:hypothetical protein
MLPFDFIASAFSPYSTKLYLSSTFAYKDGARDTHLSVSSDFISDDITEILSLLASI